MTITPERVYKIATELEDIARDVGPLQARIDHLESENQTLLEEIDELCGDLVEAYTKIAELEAELEQIKRGRDNRPKLTDREVRQIREKHERGLYTTPELAEQYGVNRSTIHRIITGVYHKDA